MSNTIRIKRRAAGGATGAPASLENAEVAYNESDAGNGILYYGYGTGGAGGSATSVVAIGGDGAFVNLTGTQTVSGNKTFTGTLDFSGATIATFETTGNMVVGGNLSVGTISTGTWNGTTIGVASGGTGQTTYTNGQLLIGNTATGSLSKATLTAGSNVTITNGNGTIEIATAAAAPVAGDGIDVSGSTVSVDLKANGGLAIESTELAVDLGASSITGTLAVADGGTGATTITGLVKGNGTGAFTAAVDETDYLSPNAEIDGGTF